MQPMENSEVVGVLLPGRLTYLVVIYIVYITTFRTFYE